MKDVFIRLCLFGLGIGAGWHALGALRSGKVALYIRYNRDRHFLRATNPSAFWTVVFAYLLFAALTLIVMPLLLLLL